MKIRICKTHSNGDREIVPPSTSRHLITPLGEVLELYFDKWVPCKSKTDLQKSTGLRDIYKQEVFEGDMLAYPEGNFNSGQSGLDDRMIVYWDEKLARFGLVFYSKWGGEGITGMVENLSDYLCKVYVIGNTFMHPEMLTIKHD